VYDNKKLKELKKKLENYESILSREMKTYRGVIHESAVSEIKHSRVMVYKALIRGLKEEIKKLEENSN
jgi:hypothetical protein